MVPSCRNWNTELPDRRPREDSPDLVVSRDRTSLTAIGCTRCYPESNETIYWSGLNGKRGVFDQK